MVAGAAEVTSKAAATSEPTNADAVLAAETIPLRASRATNKVAIRYILIFLYL
jgi:hypothetical protein